VPVRMACGACSEAGSRQLENFGSGAELHGGAQSALCATLKDPPSVMLAIVRCRRDRQGPESGPHRSRGTRRGMPGGRVLRRALLEAYWRNMLIRVALFTIMAASHCRRTGAISRSGSQRFIQAMTGGQVGPAGPRRLEEDGRAGFSAGCGADRSFMIGWKKSRWRRSMGSDGKGDLVRSLSRGMGYFGFAKAGATPTVSGARIYTSVRRAC